MERYLALIGDVVESRSLEPAVRNKLQEDLRDILLNLNEAYAKDVVARFIITTGDEFQGLLKDGWIIPDLVWAVGTRLEVAAVRFGVGYGTLHTPVQPEAIGIDGPAFHQARAAISQAKKEGWSGSVFMGFGQREDTILNGLARLLERHFEEMTEKQRSVADLLRDGLEQTEIADELGVTRQAISDHMQAIGWDAFAQGELALRTALRYLPSMSLRAEAAG